METDFSASRVEIEGFAWAYSAIFRGLLAGVRNTTMLAVSGVSRVGVAALTLSTSLLFVTANGAVVGLLGWMAGYAAEAGILALQLRYLDARKGRHR